MVSIKIIEEQVVGAKQQIAEKRAQVAEATIKLTQAKTALPDIRSQKALRGESFGGLAGRERRKRVIETERSITEKQELLRGYEGQIGKYEKESVEPVEKKIREYKEDKAGYDLAKQYYEDKVPLQFVEDEHAKKYLEEFYEQGTLTDENQAYYNQLSQTVSDEGIESLTEFEKFKFDKGIKSGILEWRETAPEVSALPEVEQLKEIGMDIPDRTEKVRFWDKITGLSIFNKDLIPTVSAANITTDLKGSTALDVPYGKPDVLPGEDSGMGLTPPVRDINISGFIGDTSDFARGFQKEKEVYSPEIGAFISASPTGPMATGTIRPPTVAERELIVKADFPSARDVGQAFLDVPFATGTIGTTKQQVQDIPFFDTTLGKSPTFIKESLADLGGQLVKTRDFYAAPTPFPALREKESKASEFILTKAAPAVGEATARYGVYAVPVVGATAFGVEAIDIAERSRVENITKETQKAIELSWREYQLEAPPGEGFRKLTKSEFIKEVSPDITAQIKSGISKEALFLGGAIVGGGILSAGFRGASRIIPKVKYGGLSKVKYQKALGLAEKELFALEREPVRWIAVQEKATGKVTLKGFQDTKKFGKELFVKGKLKKTEKGFEFFPEAEAKAFVGGKVRVGKKDFSYFGIQKFEVGAKGISVPKGKIGDVQVFKQLSVSGAIPKVESFIITRPKKLAKFLIKPRESKFLRGFREKITLGGRPTKEIATADVFQLKESVFLTAEGKRGVGITIVKKPIKSSKIKVIVSGGKKTPFAKTFQLGKTEQVAMVPKIVIPKIRKPSKMVSSLKPTITTTKGLPYMVGGTGLKLERVPYAGTGLYEQQEGVSIMELKPKVISKIRRSVLLKDALLYRQPTKLKTDLKTRQRGRLEIKTAPLIRTDVKVKVATKVRVAVKVKPAIKLKPKMITRTTTTPRTGIPKRPKQPTKIIPVFLPGKPKKKKLLKKGKKELVAPFVRRYGKFKQVGKFGTKEKVLKKGIGELKGTLGASLQLRTKGGKTIKIAKETRLFRPGKKGQDPFTLVQKKRKRLVTMQERLAIAASRKKGVKFLK